MAEEPVLRMKKPLHPGALLKESLDELGLSVKDVAKALHSTRQQIYNIVNCKNGVSPAMAIRFEKAFGGSAETWLRMQNAYDLAAARELLRDVEIKRFDFTIDINEEEK